jgi:nicotinate-nucleotide adenylyltransferase
MYKVRRIGILGGTFNPIHAGHLVLAEQTRQRLRLEKVIFVPTYFPPHKELNALAPAQERYHMVAKALKTNPFFEVSSLELARGGVSYTIETVKKFRSIYPRASLYFIIGSDSLEELSTWKNIEKLNKICKFVVVRRPGYAPRRLFPNMQVMDIKVKNISSTDIRRRIRTGKSIRNLVPEEVRKYILKKKLYR